MKLIAALTIAGLAAGCSTAPSVTGGTVTPPPPTTYDVNVQYGQPVPNVTPPQQLHITFTEAAWGDGWGGDASMMWAYRECEDMGGTMGPSDPGEYTCWNVDY
jgi:hypothetical protein